MSLPPLPSSPQKSRMNDFILFAEGIEDLFYDGLTNPDQELLLLQQVLDQNSGKLSSLFGMKHTMDRKTFQKFIKRTIDIDGDTADEIFSCATNLYRSENDNGLLVDCSMTAPQFAVAVVRVANLWAMMNEGMVDISKLSSQTKIFLETVVTEI